MKPTDAMSKMRHLEATSQQSLIPQLIQERNSLATNESYYSELRCDIRNKENALSVLRFKISNQADLQAQRSKLLAQSSRRTEEALLFLRRQHQDKTDLANNLQMQFQKQVSIVKSRQASCQQSLLVLSSLNQERETLERENKQMLQKVKQQEEFVREQARTQLQFQLELGHLTQQLSASQFRNMAARSQIQLMRRQIAELTSGTEQLAVRQPRQMALPDTQDLEILSQIPAIQKRISQQKISAEMAKSDTERLLAEKKDLGARLFGLQTKLRRLNKQQQLQQRLLSDNTQLNKAKAESNLQQLAELNKLKQASQIVLQQNEFLRQELASVVSGDQLPLM